MGTLQVLPLWVRVGLGVMVMEAHSIFPKALGLQPHHQMQFCVISMILIGGKVLPHYRDAVSIFYPTIPTGLNFL